MSILFIILFFLLVLDVASWRWGFDSTDKIDSSEWERRKLRDEQVYQHG